jgi:hypothetical protein
MRRVHQAPYPLASNFLLMGSAGPHNLRRRIIGYIDHVEGPPRHPLPSHQGRREVDLGREGTGS